MVEWCQQGAAFLERPQALQAHSVQPLEDIYPLAMLRYPPLLRHEALDPFEPGDDPLVARGLTADPMGLGEIVQLGAQVRRGRGQA